MCESHLRNNRRNSLQGLAVSSSTWPFRSAAVCRVIWRMSTGCDISSSGWNSVAPSFYCRKISSSRLKRKALFIDYSCREGVAMVANSDPLTFPDSAVSAFKKHRHSNSMCVSLWMKIFVNECEQPDNLGRKQDYTGVKNYDGKMFFGAKVLWWTSLSLWSVEFGDDIQRGWKKGGNFSILRFFDNDIICRFTLNPGKRYDMHPT